MNVNGRWDLSRRFKRPFRDAVPMLRSVPPVKLAGYHRRSLRGRAAWSQHPARSDLGTLNIVRQPTVGRNRAIHLYLRFALTPSNESGVATFHAQAYIPTQPAQAIQDTRISHAHEDPGRQEGHFPPARQGAQAGLGKTRLPRIVPALTFCGADTLVREP
jgi:hypothetical protein